MIDDAPNWPGYLRVAMKSAGHRTTADLAAASGISDSVISRWLHGKTSPSAENLRKLVKPLNRPYIELLVAGGVMSPAEAKMRDQPAPPPRPVGSGVDPAVLADLEHLSDAQVRRVRDFLQGIKGS